MKDTCETLIKSDPVMITDVPILPEVGFKSVIVGEFKTLKVTSFPVPPA